MFLSNVKFLIKSTISSTQGTGTTFNISEDFETGTHIESTSPISIVLKNQTQIERMTITATGGVATIVKRGLTQADTKVEDNNLKRIWNDGTIGYVTALASDLLDIDKSGGIIEIKSDVDFTGEVEFSDSVEINNTLRIPTFNNTGARDAVFTSPENGNSCFVIGIGQMVYSGGVWQPLLEGLPTPNASTTVSGKVEIATNAEMDAGTNTGGTGAILVGTPSQFKRKEFVEGFNVGGLTETTTLTETDEFLLNQGGNKKITTANLLRANKEVFVAGENITAGNALRNGAIIDNSYLITQSTNSGSINFGLATGNVERRGQTFLTNSTDLILQKIKIGLAKIGSPTDNVQLKIYASDRTTLIATSTNTISSGSLQVGGNQDFNFTFNNIILTGATTYFIEVTRTSTLDNTNYYQIGYSSTSTYPNGTNFYYQSGVWTADATTDLYFTITFGNAQEDTTKVYKTDASSSSKINFIGFATNTATTGNNVIVDTSGVSATQSGLTIGSDYYLSNTPGAISTTPGTNVVNVGKAVSATGIEVDSGDKIKTDIINISRDTSLATGVITYNHGLGKIPKSIQLSSLWGSVGITCNGGYANNKNYSSYSYYTYSGGAVLNFGQSTTSSINHQNNTGSGQFGISGVIQNLTTTSFDIAWTKIGTSTGNVYLTAILLS